MRALLYGVGYGLFEDGAPALLTRAGFRVTVIVKSSRERRCRGAERIIRTESVDALIAMALEEALSGYDFVGAGDDETLLRVRHSDLPAQHKVLLLPICSAQNLNHVGSKFGLSQALTAANILTPDWEIARDADELQRAAARIGLPVLLKADTGGGGAGVKDFDPTQSDLSALTFPLLVQKKIDGHLFDLSGIFVKGKPAFFSVSEVLSSVPEPYGPSAVRRYFPGRQNEPDLWDVMVRLGSALGADGFCNISAIRSASDNRLYFIEADLRPNVWIEYPRYYGEDPALYIRKSLKRDSVDSGAAGAARKPVVMGYLPRLSFREIAVNKYDCRSHYQNYCNRAVIWKKAYAPIKTLRQRVTKILSRGHDGPTQEPASPASPEH